MRLGGKTREAGTFSLAVNFNEAEYRRVMRLLERLVIALEAEVTARRTERELHEVESHRVERSTAGLLLTALIAAALAYVFRGQVAPFVQANVGLLAVGVSVATALGALLLRAVRMGTISLSNALFTIGMFCTYGGFAVLLSTDPLSPFLAVVCGWSLYFFWFRTYAVEDVVNGKTWVERMRPVFGWPLALGSPLFMFVLTFRALVGNWLTAILAVGGTLAFAGLLVSIALGLAWVRNARARSRSSREPPAS